MAYSFIQVLIPFIAIIVNVAVQILICKSTIKIGFQNHQRSLKVSVGLGILSGIIFIFSQAAMSLNFTFSLLGNDALNIITSNLLIYLAFSYWYIVFITLGETSLRTRILLEIDKAGQLSEVEILALYNTQVLTKIRLERLINTGLINFRKGRYFGMPSMLVNYAKALGYMHFFVFGHKGDYR